jgi:hypothetical protein
MRRLYAIALVCVIGWPMLWPALADASALAPHACCFRKHHSSDSSQKQFESRQNHDCCRSVRTVARVAFEPGELVAAPVAMQSLELRLQYAPPVVAALGLLPVRAPPVA